MWSLKWELAHSDCKKLAKNKFFPMKWTKCSKPSSVIYFRPSFWSKCWQLSSFSHSLQLKISSKNLRRHKCPEDILAILFKSSGVGLKEVFLNKIKQQEFTVKGTQLSESEAGEGSCSGCLWEPRKTFTIIPRVMLLRV